MEVWFVLEANNCDIDIWISEPFQSQESAKEYLLERYHENISELEEDNLEYHWITDNTYSILTYGNDYYYGVIRSVNLKEVEE